jgi:replicative DNA helicase
MTDRLLPHNTEAEEAVLGSILIDQHAVQRISALLKPGDFYDERNRHVYEAMLDLSRNGTPPDFLAVCDLLERRGQLEGLGGMAYITDLVNSTPTSIHAEYYAGNVARYAVRRQVIETATEIAAQAYDTNGSDPLAFAQDRIAELEKQRRLTDVKGSTWADLDQEIGPIEWTWPGWLPVGFLTMIVGEQETGKSILTLRIVACFLRGDPWPDGKSFTGETGKVVWAEAEASQAMNLQRAKSWDLPIDNVLHPLSEPLEDVQLNDHRHRAAITALAQQPDVRLVVVDSLSGGHQEEEKSASGMIPTVKWMAELARDTGKQVIMTHHLRKRGVMDLNDRVTLDRVRGSSGITQMARMVWAVDAPNPSDPDKRRLSVIKSNLAPKPEPLGFTVDGGRLVFGDAPEPPRQDTQLERAIDLLLTQLDSGPMPSTKLMEEATGAAISWNTMRRAKEHLGIIAKRDNGRWYWALPASEAGQ